MRPSRALVPVAALALLLAACGDDDTTTAADDTTVDDTTADTGDGDARDDAGDDDRREVPGVGSCGFLAGFAPAFEDFDPTTMYGGGEAIDYGQIFEPMARAMSDVASSAPSEIRDSFETMAERFEEVADRLEGVVIDLSDPMGIDPEAASRLEALETSFDDEFEAASDQVGEWLEANCSDFADVFDLDAFRG